MFEVLHQCCVRLVHDDHLDGREEVIVAALLLVASLNGSPQTQRRGKDDIRVVEGRVQLECLASQLDTDTELVLIVAFKELAEVFWPVVRELVFWSRVVVQEALLVLLLLESMQFRDGIQYAYACLFCLEQEEDLWSCKALVTILYILVSLCSS